MTIKQTLRELGQELWYVLIHLLYFMQFVVFSPVIIAGFLWSSIQDMWDLGWHSEINFSAWLSDRLREADAADARRIDDKQ